MVHGKAQGDGSPKRELVLLRLHHDEGGPPPAELVEAQLCERFGWTPTELDEQDEGRISRMVILLNMDRAYQHVLSAVRSHRLDVLSEAHWKVYRAIKGTKQP